ncbi:MAG TPA: monovalent cation/H(+) antiporter subunit G [Pseudomonadaceae bacterium]|nr:monovalent cation/H(+) antiporter subunit G [Pseudomonadaceae bacterium]
MSTELLATVLDVLSWGCLLSGGFLGFSGAVGLFRFPDFFTRLHAASVTDTLATGLIVLGLILQANSLLMVLKLGLVLAILLYTSPTSAHSLGKSAIRGGLKPLQGDEARVK